MKPLAALLLLSALVVAGISPAGAQGNRFDVRYLGGTFATKKGKPKDWSNILTVTPARIELLTSKGEVVTIDPKMVNALSAGEDAKKRVKTYSGFAFIVPFVFFKVSPKERRKFVGIEYSGEDGKNGALLLQAKDDEWVALRVSLESVTGKSIKNETVTK
jgi:hypothetical protein